MRRISPPPRGAADTLAGAQGDYRIVARVAPWLWPEGEGWAKRRVVAALVMLALAKALTVMTPFLYKAVVDALAPDQVPAGEAAGGMAEFALLVGPIGLVVAYGMSRLMGAAFQQLRDVAFARVGQRALRGLARAAIGHVHALSMRYHIQRQTGALSRVIDRGVKAVDFLLSFLLFSLFPLFLELALVAIIFLVEFDWRYFAVVLAMIAGYVWFTFAVTEWRVKIRRIMNNEDQDANQKAVDSLLNFETVKYFGAEAREVTRYDRSMARYENAAVKTANSLAFLNGGQAAVIAVGLVAVMAMAAQGVRAGELSVGDFVMVNAFIIQITMPLGFLGTVYREIRQALVDMQEMFGLLDQPPEVADKPDAGRLARGPGRIEFRDVRFAYEPDRPILKGVSIAAEGGETVAVVGATGSGKSTLGRLLFRFYDVQGGAVLVDGQDVRDVTQVSLREAIGVVPQDTVLFNDTIGYNIGYGREGATRAEIEDAARAARIHSFVESLPKGYDTVVGERGLKLSGGEKQRVAIARAMLKNPSILVLDEATSALDTDTEREIQESLRRLGAGRTTLVVAHRLSTVIDADRIVVLEAGEVVESGRHAELLERGGRYAQLWARQQEGEEASV